MSLQLSPAIPFTFVYRVAMFCCRMGYNGPICSNTAIKCLEVEQRKLQSACMAPLNFKHDDTLLG